MIKPYRLDNARDQYSSPVAAPSGGVSADRKEIDDEDQGLAWLDGR